jgi:hypothetical protein
VLHDQPGPLWTAFAPVMRSALGDSVQWAARLHAIVTSIGTLDSLASEDIAEPRPGVFVVDAHAHFHRSPMPLELIMAFDSSARVTGLLVRPEKGAEAKEFPSTHLDYVTRTPLRLPVNGEWFVVWGGRTLKQNYHAIARDQRFALDILMVKDGHTHAGEGGKLTDYYCWDQPILAPAPGMVVWVQDSLPDNKPGLTDSRYPTGNSLVLDVGHGEYLLFAHMRYGSRRVRVGDAVAQGTELGRVGNSGNTTEPHLHVHMQDGPTPFEADGLPVQWLDYVADDKPVARGEPVQGQRIRRAP